MDPYAPPQSDVSSAPPKARRSRISLVLAAVGFVCLWGTAVLVKVLGPGGNPTSAGNVALGAAALLALILHLVGASLALTKRRRSWGGLVANLVPILLFAGLMALGGRSDDDRLGKEPPGARGDVSVPRRP